jgi:hypothetical protein
MCPAVCSREQLILQPSLAPHAILIGVELEWIGRQDRECTFAEIGAVPVAVPLRQAERRIRSVAPRRTRVVQRLTARIWRVGRPEAIGDDPRAAKAERGDEGELHPAETEPGHQQIGLHFLCTATGASGANRTPDACYACLP